MLFTGLTVFEWAVILIVLTVLRRIHLDVYAITATAIIVGLHLLLLGRLFRNVGNYLAGSLLTIWATGAAFFTPVDIVQSTTALGVGILLWLSGAIILAFAAHAVRSCRILRIA